MLNLKKIQLMTLYIQNCSYRKALQMMNHVDHHGFPIISFIDTPSAYAEKQFEEKGQVY